MRTLGSYPPLNEQEASAAAEALFQAARPLFAGAAPEVVGLALAQLTALWLAGYQAPGAPREIIESPRQDDGAAEGRGAGADAGDGSRVRHRPMTPCISCHSPSAALDGGTSRKASCEPLRISASTPCSAWRAT